MIEDLKNRVKDLAKDKGYTLNDIAVELGILYNALYQRLSVSPKMSTLESIAKILNCSVQELLPAPQGYSHFYDDQTGEWLGIRKK